MLASAEQAVSHDHEHDDQCQTINGGRLAFLDRIKRPKPAPADALLDGRQPGGQCTGPQKIADCWRDITDAVS